MVLPQRNATLGALPDGRPGAVLRLLAPARGARATFCRRAEPHPRRRRQAFCAKVPAEGPAGRERWNGDVVCGGVLFFRLLSAMRASHACADPAVLLRLAATNLIRSGAEGLRLDSGSCARCQRARRRPVACSLPGATINAFSNRPTGYRFGKITKEKGGGTGFSFVRMP